MYARSISRTTRTAGVGLACGFEAAFNGSAVIGFKGGQAGPEKLALRHDDDVEPRCDVIVTENLSYQTFSAISLDRAAEFFRCRDAQPTHRRSVGPDEQRAVAAMDASAALVNFLKLGVAPDPLARAEPQ